MDLRSSIHPYETADDILLYDNVTHYNDSQAFMRDESFVVPVNEHFISSENIEGEFEEKRTILADGADQFGVTALAFDSREELLWMGNEGGHVTSYYSSDLQKYTSFQVHATEEVRCLHTFENGVLALMPSALRCQIRRGIPVFTHCSENMEHMQCLLQLSSQTLLLGGHTHKLIEFDLNTYQEVNLIDVGKNGCAILREHNRFICCGDPFGQIQLRAPNTLRVEHYLETHTGSLSDFDIHGNLLVTCGFSNRQGGLAVDRFLMVYDLRMLRAVSPITLVLDPLLLRFMPSFSSRIAVASALGQVQLVDTVTLSEPDLTIYQVGVGSALQALDVTSSCQALAVGDSGGGIHLFSSQNNSMFNAFSQPTEFADPIEPFEPISITDTLAILSSIPLVYTTPLTTVLSDWPKEFLQNAYRPTPPIDPDILRTMKMQGTVGYAPNPNTKLRNQVPYNIITQPPDQDVLTSEESSPVFPVIPRRYRKQDMKFSKPGSEELDADQYNKTLFSGLEATLPNSYCNAMIQVLYFLEPLRHVVLSHMCHAEFCLCCELAFLFRMLDMSKGQPCHAGNFLRALRNAHEASALGLILPDQSNPDLRKKTNLTSLIQNWNRFILHQIHYELLEEAKRQEKENPKAPPFVYKDTDFPSIDLPRNKRRSRTEEESGVSSNIESKDEETEITRLFGTKQTHVHRCLRCQREVSKESSLLVCNLIYPENECGRAMSFCEVLGQSLCPQQTTPAWCDQCERFLPTEQSRRIKSLPPLLTVNCGMDNNQEKSFWQTQMDILVKNTVDSSTSPGSKPCRYGTTCARPDCRFKHPDQKSPSRLYSSNAWLPQHIQVDLRSNGQVNIIKLDKPEACIPPDKETVVQSEVYNLCAVVCYIHEDRKNLVGIVNVGPGHLQRASGSATSGSQWYIFNDFRISPVNSHEAVWFPLDWKVPCILYWVSHQTADQVLPTPILEVPVDVFMADSCLATSGRGVTYTPLAAHEIPGPGDLVAMDAEFVTLNQEESELRSDGKMATIKPSHKSLARISCIRGQGPKKGVPFIDDYISTQEQVVDYVTQFSGIKPGDLDANYSSKHLTTLKSTYLKLRYLVDNGVIFVGHGLRNDFRVINVVVPPDQVKDTVHLFHLPHQRMVSLRFLSWHFLKKKIQSKTHDSIEDARAALQLYEKYLELEAQQLVQSSLEEMYKQGIAMQWKVPED